jgi:hypothetical protein
MISAPPPEPDYAQWKVPNQLKQDIKYANNVFYGKNGANWKMEKHRICWYVPNSSDQYGPPSNILQGTLSPQPLTSSSPRTRVPKASILQPAVLSTATSSSRCWASTLRRCWRASREAGSEGQSGLAKVGDEGFDGCTGEVVDGTEKIGSAYSGLRRSRDMDMEFVVDNKS